MVLKTAGLGDAPAIKQLFDAYPAEILPIPLKQILQSIAAGQVLWENGVALMYRICPTKSYYGVPVGSGSYQILDIAATTQGDGSAARMLEYFCNAVRRPVFLFVKTDNARGIRFYEKHQFNKARQVNFQTFSSFIMVRDARR